MHGEQNEMMRLKAGLMREYEENDETLLIHSPANAQTVELHFRGEKMAKVTFQSYFLIIIISSDDSRAAKFMVIDGMPAV